MSALTLDREPGSPPAAALSVLVHAALLAFLFFGIHWQTKTPDAVVVELWDRPPVVEPAQPAVEPVPPVETPRPEPKAQEPPPPKPEPKPVKPDIAVEKKKEPPKKEPPKKEPPRKEEPKLKIERDAAIREQLMREMEQVSKAPRPASAAAPRIDASYANKIKTKIKGNIVLPPGIAGNPESIFEVLQLPTGEVLSVRLRKSSGNQPYDEAVERAILKSSPLPRPDRPEQFARELQLKFRPLE